MIMGKAKEDSNDGPSKPIKQTPQKRPTLPVESELSKSIKKR